MNKNYIQPLNLRLLKQTGRLKVKNIIKWVISILIIMIILLYVILTIPHAFIRKNQQIKIVSMSYTENILKQNSNTLKSYSLENGNEISNIVDTLNHYQYRHYIMNRNLGFKEATAEIRINIYYNNGKNDLILVYSDGQFFVNAKSSHIGLSGNRQAQELYNVIYDRYKKKFE